MCEDLEPIVTGDADEYYAGRIGRSHSQRWRGRYSQNDGLTDHARLLHQLNRNSAQENDNAIRDTPVSAQ